jgi:hypothetical protein
MGSKYLLKHPRTLREACRDNRAARRELINADCDACSHGELCAISEQIERDRREREDESQAVSWDLWEVPI